VRSRSRFDPVVRSYDFRAHGLRKCAIFVGHEFASRPLRSQLPHFFQSYGFWLSDFDAFLAGVVTSARRRFRAARGRHERGLQRIHVDV
ncbi:hypothetical protein M513_14391, partial [Trichuris suis]